MSPFVYKAEKDHCQHYPKPVSEDLFGGVARNFQVFEPLDFLAEITQHIPNKSEHPIRYYGYYSNKARGQRTQQAAAQTAGANTSGKETPSAPPISSNTPGQSPADQPPPIIESAKLDRRRWAILIQRHLPNRPAALPKMRRNDENHLLHRGPPGGGHPQNPPALRPVARSARPRAAPTGVKLPARSANPGTRPRLHPRGRPGFPRPHPSRGVRPARPALGVLNSLAFASSCQSWRLPVPRPAVYSLGIGLGRSRAMNSATNWA